MNDSLEILNPAHLPKGRVRTAIFDFDGTFSTLRCGWEEVMREMMLDMISGGKPYDASLAKIVEDYIDSSAGIQTVYQMQWLKEMVEKAHPDEPEHDVWWYKDEYNRRLMINVEARIRRLETGEDSPEQYLISGAVEFLTALKDAGVEAYLASGTDHEDVLHEAEVLGVKDMFSGIKGAPRRQAACSKEAVIKMLLEENGGSGEHLLLVGDGKVEIALGAQSGAFTLGVATDEKNRRGINPLKRERLKKAGADVIIGDFENLDAVLNWLGC